MLLVASDMNYPVSGMNGSVRGEQVHGQTAVPPAPHSVLQFLQGEEKMLFKRRKKVVTLRRDNAHVELLPPLILAQLISLFPINGISGPDINSLQFRWRSLKVAYCFFMLFIQFIFWIGTIKRYIIIGVTYSAFGDVLFYGGSACMSFVFLRLARGWKDFMGQWLSVQGYMNDMKEYSVRNKIKFITIWLALSSVSEHILANTEGILAFSKLKEARLQSYLLDRHQEVFLLVPYSTVLGLLLHFSKLILTMIWNYTDIFLASVSLALGKMFKQFTLDLESTSKDVSPETSLNYWKKRREIYSKLSLLTKLVDEKFSILVLFSFSMNLYYICIQLLNTIKPLESLSHMVYFGGSFGHLLCRTCAVCFAASSVYENSKQPLGIIFSVPSEQFNVEIAGTIVTYEIVLYQFSGLNEPTPTTPANNLTLTN